MQHITPLQFKDTRDENNQILLDIREPYEIEICHIGGLQIPMGEVSNRLSEIDKNKEVIVLCRSGKRAVAVANLIETDFEYPKVTILEGGILAWIDQVDNSLEAY